MSEVQIFRTQILPTNPTESSFASTFKTLASHIETAFCSLSDYSTFGTLNKSFLFLELFHHLIIDFIFFPSLMFLAADPFAMFLFTKNTELMMAFSTFLDS